MQNLVTIPQGVSFPHMCEIAHQHVYSASFFPGSSNSLQPRRLDGFSRVIRQMTRFRARLFLFGVRRQNLIFTPRNSRKTAILGPDFDVSSRGSQMRLSMCSKTKLRHARDKTRLNEDVYRVSSWQRQRRTVSGTTTTWRTKWKKVYFVMIFFQPMQLYAE